MWCQLGGLGDHGDIGLKQSPAGGLRPTGHVGEKPHRIGVLVCRVGVGKEPADVTKSDGAEHGVGDCVGNRIGIGVTGEPLRMRNGDAAENQGAAAREPMRVIADPHARHATATSCSGMIE